MDFVQTLPATITQIQGLPDAPRLPEGLRPSPAGQISRQCQVENDAQVVEMWLYGRSPHTIRSYGASAARFLNLIGRPLQAVRIEDVQRFDASMNDIAPASRGCHLAAVKSLLSFGHRIGYLQFDVGRPVRMPAGKDDLAERILGVDELLKLLHLGPKTPRDRVLLRLLYASGGRISELCGLRWRDVQPNDDAGQVSLFGKGRKTRQVRLSADTWKALQSIRGETGPDDPVFRSRIHGGALSPGQAWRVVKAAAKRVGLQDRNVSPHWFRHAHASHALDRGAPIHLVQATLGHSSVATTGRYLHARPTESSSKFLPV